MIFDDLKKPFKREDLEWRVLRAGVHKSTGEWAMVMTYVNNRAIMDRLDKVLGPGCWQNKFAAGPDGGVICGIGIGIEHKDDDGDEWLDWRWKWDGAPNTDIESVKGGLSDAMKRAAVQWGIGRYLYRLPATFAKVTSNGEYRANGKDKYSGVEYNFKWDPPDLPDWALPEDDKLVDKEYIEETQNKIGQLIEDAKDILSEETVQIYRTDYGAIRSNEDARRVLGTVEDALIKLRREERKAEKEIY